MLKVITSLLLTGIATVALAFTTSLPNKNNSLIGKVLQVPVEANDNFFTIAQRYDVGYYELIQANPNLNPAHLHEGDYVVVPRQYVLPNVPRQGVVINLAELRLYYFPKGKKEVITYPVGIGREGWMTPEGTFSIVEKRKNPIWYVPETIRQAQWEERGVELPTAVPPGPDNPLGEYAMRLSKRTYLIHGTNDPRGVGRRASSGCIRLFPADIKELYSLVENGAQITIVDEPYKLGWEKNKLYLESHLPLQEKQDDHAQLGPMKDDLKRELKKYANAHIDWREAQAIAREHEGIPQVIGER